jgi:hypothetical protein
MNQQHTALQMQSLDQSPVAAITMWAAKVMKVMEDVRWKRIGYEALPNGLQGKPLFNMTNPEKAFSEIESE